MMLRTSELNLDIFGEMNDELRGTILHQESIFKHQVRELHRLYWMQKTLMRELYQKGLDAKECKLRMIDSLNEDNVGSLEVVKGKSIDANNTRCRGFHLELPASAYIEHSVKHSVNNGISRSVNYVRDVNNYMVAGKGDHLLCHEVIDLEDDVEIRPNVKAVDVPLHGFKIPTMNCEMANCSMANVVCDMPSSSSKVEKNVPGFMLDLNQVYDECSKSLQEQNVDPAGLNDSSSAVGLVDATTTVTDHKPEEPVTNSSKPMLIIDLNIPQEDESSYHTPNDHPIIHTFSSQSSSSSVAQAEVNGDRSNSNDFHGEISPSNTAKKKELPSTENKKSSFGEKPTSTVTAENNALKDRVVLNHAQSEDTISTYAVKPSKDDNQQKNLPNLIKTDDAEHQDSHDSALSDAAKILAAICLETQQSDDDKTQPLVDDSVTKEEDEDDRYRPQYSIDSFETMMLESPEVTSCEKAAMVRALQIEKEEEDVGSSRRGCRLRRGRGRVVKDFQKNILPGLVTLSRHEIYEDMHSIGFELRKNGGRRARGGVGGGGGGGGGGSNWFVPVRSRRSKLNRNRNRNRNSNI